MQWKNVVMGLLPEVMIMMTAVMCKRRPSSCVASAALSLAEAWDISMIQDVNIAGATGDCEFFSGDAVTDTCAPRYWITCASSQRGV